MPTLRQRAVSRTPSGNPVWRELEDLPLRYRAMPADDQARATERAALREAIYRQMAGTMVRHVLGQAMAAEMAASAGGVAAVCANTGTATSVATRAAIGVREKMEKGEESALARRERGWFMRVSSQGRLKVCLRAWLRVEPGPFV